MATYTIVTAEHKKDLTLDHGDFKVYALSLQGQDGTVELKQKAASPPPAQGQRIDGTIEDGPYGKVFKKEFAPRTGGGGKSPKESAQIARMNAQTQALKYWELKHTADPSFVIASWGDFTRIVNLFFDDVRAAGDAA